MPFSNEIRAGSSGQSTDDNGFNPLSSFARLIGM